MSDLKETLNQETGAISWAELIRHFARGVVIKVDTDIDLIDVAHHIASDNTAEMQSMLNACLLYTSPSPRDKRQSRMPSSA